MEPFSFPRYLAAKRSVDDRALNPRVWAALAARLRSRESSQPLRVLEIGAGTGTMIARMAENGLLDNAHVHALDAEEENIAAARAELAQWGRERGAAWYDMWGIPEVDPPKDNDHLDHVPATKGDDWRGPYRFKPPMRCGIGSQIPMKMRGVALISTSVNAVRSLKAPSHMAV